MSCLPVRFQIAMSPWERIGDQTTTRMVSKTAAVVCVFSPCIGYQYDLQEVGGILTACPASGPLPLSVSCAQRAQQYVPERVFVHMPNTPLSLRVAGRPARLCDSSRWPTPGKRTNVLVNDAFRRILLVTLLPTKPHGGALTLLSPFICFCISPSLDMLLFVFTTLFL